MSMSMRNARVTLPALAAIGLLAGCNTTSVGVILGDPSGLALRNVLQSDRMLNVAVGVNNLDNQAVRGHVDYTMYPTRVRRESWNPYWGFGLDYVADANENANNDNVGVGLRVPLGVSFDSSGWDFFGQAAVRVGENNVNVGLAMGLRFSL